MNDKPIDVEAVHTQAVAVREAGAVVAAQSPLDMEPAQFRAGLDRRKANRASLMDWVRSALVEGTDFGRIPTKRGPSKPSLWKPGAEKICGMLGVMVTFPNLSDYEQAALKGTKLENIILRCEILSANGGVVASGVGARSLAQDYGDLNKCLKMAEKSAHIDATLRMAGLSEVFTQDIEDMPKDTAAPAHQPPPTRQAPAAPTQPTAPKAATDTTRGYMIEQLNAHQPGPDRDVVLEFLINAGVLMPNEALEEWPLRWVPNSKQQLAELKNAIATYAKTGGQCAMPYKMNPEGEPTKAKPVEVPRDKVQPQDDTEAWRQFPMPFGKNAGVPLEELEKKYLFGLWANYTVEEEYNGKPKKPETIAKDTLFRQMLDLAGEHYDFTKND